ncbi:zinc ribbon domain-containing protein [Geobacillus stearothermophilus]|nr:zinc ribbon domain-containing protein [Geobacillus stearothermophilus]MED5043613.1 zinc ribbon domain-containing protein [Geobacillus stearothermophilus]
MKWNRDTKRFRCQRCGYTLHADLNGAINIAKAISGFAVEPSALVTGAPPIGVHPNPMGRGDDTSRSFCVVRTRNG